MRVIAGTAKKRKLITPAGLTVRPTSDRVKEALFSILGESVAASCFLDLFAGAGTVGIEALSRGAEKVVFVEKETNNIRIIKKNLQVTGLADKARCMGVTVDKAVSLLASEKVSFDLIFMDPPYMSDHVADTLNSITGNNLLLPDGLVVVESNKNTLLPEYSPDGLNMFRRALYGDTVLAFYRY